MEAKEDEGGRRRTKGGGGRRRAGEEDEGEDEDEGVVQYVMNQSHETACNNALYAPISKAQKPARSERERGRQLARLPAAKISVTPSFVFFGRVFLC